ncbi:CinA family protein [Clostridium sp. NSJ-49]|jgi:PncC family amidohydrolase|uniref:Competence damage-inducible protein A n=1 Tax=Clostridium disporicum TaxID=84024 RepID=A0A174LN91_9CLOT|nr:MULTISPECIES: nicotinamide-nucleotide amidohydrolase family protein [Clostridium]MBC5627144.1 CinA family protein [Clostridium sp. NSJ-49]MCD2503306.1 CinA family protein [Clostridium sp. NSJ-145]CUP25573.1 competence damage-inducible protein A [Clostridium disporicum]
MKNIDINKDLEYIIGEILIKNHLTISTAESCTGGMVAAKLISYPGISAAYLEGSVTYSNEAKISRLGVREETLLQYGAVSEETAREMVNGIAKVSGSKVAISTTGLAGPGGGSIEKPVGLVYIGIYLNGETVVKKFNFTGERNEIRKETTISALKMLIDLLTKRGYL